ncbi:hypothetical protein SDC9_156711 [bioreactor metagenome]|uniref:Uncharacterized protein n=1 Tax=bioreactor metagenome TaxID=1076179 RepID=A0A645F569_9ZZZZ
MLGNDLAGRRNTVGFALDGFRVVQQQHVAGRPRGHIELINDGVGRYHLGETLIDDTVHIVVDQVEFADGEHRNADQQDQQGSEGDA